MTPRNRQQTLYGEDVGVTLLSMSPSISGLSENQTCKKDTSQRPRGAVLTSPGHADARQGPASNHWRFSGNRAELES